MRVSVALVSAVWAAAFLLTSGSCGNSDSNSDSPTSSPSPVSTPSPASTRAPGTPGPAVRIGERVTFYGADPGDSAAAIAAGDFNADTRQDFVLGAALADGPGNGRPDGGEAYIFLGPFQPGERDPAAGQYDVVIYGAAAGDQLGRAVTTGDFDGDGVDDLALGAPMGDGASGDRSDSGQVYVLLGSKALGKELREVDLATDRQGVAIYGADAGDLAGFALDAAAVNADPYADLIIGAFWADGPDNARSNAGEVYVILGAPQPESVDLRSGEQDVTIFGARSEDRLGEGLRAGDVNGDGTADLLVVATFGDGPDNDRDRAGETYVLLSPPTGVIDLASGGQVATILGVDPGDQMGHSAASGDLNGDGFDDVLLGAVSADGPGNSRDLAGEAAIVPGSAQISGLIDIAGGASPVIYGASSGDRLGRSVATGDLNGDGMGDALIAAPRAVDGTGAKPSAGAVYIFLGRSPLRYPPTISSADLVLYGDDAGDDLGNQVSGMRALLANDMDGDGLNDILASASAADGPGDQRQGCGEAYIIFVRKQ